MRPQVHSLSDKGEEAKEKDLPRGPLTPFQTFHPLLQERGGCHRRTEPSGHRMSILTEEYPSLFYFTSLLTTQLIENKRMWISKKVTITITPKSSLQKFGILICIALCPPLCKEYHEGSEFILLCLNPTKKPLMCSAWLDSLTNAFQPRL